MKYDFTDRDLECAAKNVLDALANENKVSPQIRYENNYINVSAAETTHKIRKTIIKTARLYVIAAVLIMILAGTLLLGAIYVAESNNNSEILLSYTKNAYMCVNNDASSEKNMPVTVTINFEKTGDYVVSHKNVGHVFSGDVVIKDMKGNIIAEFYDIELKYNQDKGYGFYDEYKAYRLEHGGQAFIDQVDPSDFSAINVKFSNKWQNVVIFYYDKMTMTGSRSWTYSLEDCIFIVSDADSREDAIEKAYEYHKKECSECADLGDQGHIK